MPQDVRLPVVVVSGLHEAQRRRAVLELLEGCAGAVVLHHDLRDASGGVMHRHIRDDKDEFAPVAVPLTNDCPCCAVREDLLPELARIAGAGQHRLAVVELWGGSDPHPVVELIAGGEVDETCMHESSTAAGSSSAAPTPTCSPTRRGATRGCGRRNWRPAPGRSR